jgi:hypothetical protein
MFLQCPVRRFSIRRMLGSRCNPQARNLFEIAAYLQHAEGVCFEVRSTRPTSRRKHAPPILEQDGQLPLAIEYFGANIDSEDS